MLIYFLTSFTVCLYGQTEQEIVSTPKEKKQIEVFKSEAPIYQLFSTQNTWALIKLDTRNGKLWQVHFTISKEGYEGLLDINSNSLVSSDEEINGRFTLYPTQNIYNFILLDQINGKTYKVQWNNDSDKRFIRRIY